MAQVEPQEGGSPARTPAKALACQVGACTQGTAKFQGAGLLGGSGKKGSPPGEDYAFLADKFHDVVQALGVGEPKVDVFASPANARCTTCWNPENSAFAKQWGAQGLLWINPPFSQLSEVVNKIETDGAECLLVCPDWSARPWFAKAQLLCAKAHFYPPGSRLFETDKGPAGPTRWGVWVLYIPAKSNEMRTVRVVENREGGNEKQLRVVIRLTAEDREVVPPCTALIDTGAEVCLVKRGLIPPELFRPARQPLRLVGADGNTLPGGDKEVVLEVGLKGILKDSKKEAVLRIPTIFYEAEVKDPVILSYGWCQVRGFDIFPRLHGLNCKRKGREYWVEGVRSAPGGNLLEAICAVGADKPKRALDLFSGTGSAKKVLEKEGFEVISLDSEARFQPTLCCDILGWDYKEYPPGYFDIITASPPCTEFSQAKTVGERKVEQALKLVQKTLEIVEYFRPKVWWLETPRYGLLTKNSLLANVPHWDVDYCQFGRGGFKKPTRFYGSAHLAELPSFLCDGKSCPNLGEGRKHSRPLGGHFGAATKALTYPIPSAIITGACGLGAPHRKVWFQAGGAPAQGAVCGVGGGVGPNKKVRFTLPNGEGGAEVPPTDPEIAETEPEVDQEAPDAPYPDLDSQEFVRQKWVQEQIREKACWTRDPEEHPEAINARKRIEEKFADSVLSGVYVSDPPIRGPFGEAEIWVAETTCPVGRPAFRMGGDKLEAHT
ncbi:hypothetical protein M569_12700, partial [Genlisea aurea]